MVAWVVDGCLRLLEFKDRAGLKVELERLKQQIDRDLLIGEHPIVEKTKEELEGYFAGENQGFSIPLAKVGTSFENLVWQNVKKIPYGQTRTYAQIASKIEKPTATRAVGRANGRNPFAIVIPCHRLIGSDGELHGYGGGLWRKQWLLDFEKKHKK